MSTRSKANPQEVLRRLEAVENKQAILETMYQYAHSIDYGREEDFLDCFTRDGVIEHWWRGERREDHFKGRKALAEHFPIIRATRDRWIKHLLLAPVIRINGDRASAESLWAYLADSDGAPILRSFGRYRDKLVKGADGKWRIKERIIEPEARAGFGVRMASFLRAKL